MNIDTTTETDTKTEIEPLGENLSPPIRIFYRKNGRAKYIPVSFERKLIQYDITISQGIYPNGRLGTTWLNIKTDSSKNVIKNRFEILDL